MFEENFHDTTLGFPFSPLCWNDSFSTPPLSPYKSAYEEAPCLLDKQYDKIDELLARLSNVDSEPFNMILSQSNQNSQFGFYESSETKSIFNSSNSPASPFDLLYTHVSSVSAPKEVYDSNPEPPQTTTDSLSFEESNFFDLEDIVESCYDNNQTIPQLSQIDSSPVDFSPTPVLTLVNTVCEERSQVPRYNSTQAYNRTCMLTVAKPSIPMRNIPNTSNSNLLLRGGNHIQSSARICTEVMKRSNHNSLERRRREDLRGMLNDLRKLIPQLLHNERSSKVIILEKSKKFIDELHYREMSLIEKLRVSRTKTISLALKVKEKSGCKFE